jgi:hypothetical protein
VELGSGETHSIREIVQQLSDVVACPVEPQVGASPDRPLERVKKADIVASRKLIGWQPSTSLRAGLTRTVEWYKKTNRTYSVMGQTHAGNLPIESFAFGETEGAEKCRSAWRPIHTSSSCVGFAARLIYVRPRAKFTVQYAARSSAVRFSYAMSERGGSDQERRTGTAMNFAELTAKA